MSKPLEYVVRIRMDMARKPIKGGQEEKLRYYMSEGDHVHTADYMRSIDADYDPESEKCRNCEQYLLCDILAQIWKEAPKHVKAESLEITLFGDIPTN